MSVPVSWAQLCAAIEGVCTVRGGCLLAVDGMCGSGKSTLGARLARRFDANLFHCDDFYLPPELRTPARLEEPGGNMHRERLREEILENLLRGKPFSYRPLVTPDLMLGEPVFVEPRPVSIIEGSYSMHPDLREYYDLSVFLRVSPQTQEDRILARNGPAKLEEFRARWIPLENRYFDSHQVETACRYLWAGENITEG